MQPAGSAEPPGLPNPPATHLGSMAAAAPGALGLPSTSDAPQSVPLQPPATLLSTGIVPKDAIAATRADITTEGMDHDISSISSESSTTMTYEYAKDGTLPSNEEFQLVVPPKRRRGSKRSLSVAAGNAAASAPKHGLTVILKPLDSKKLLLALIHCC